MTGWLLSAEAEEDLQDIFLYSEESWGEAQARDYLLGLYDLFEIIANNPQIGRERQELGPGIRSLAHVSHVIFFLDWQGEVAIVRVLHKARDVDSQFEGYDPSGSLK
ncbi:type II toxin-antitoxin system RelE/ParE family toxin [Roseibium sp. M-1]